MLKLLVVRDAMKKLILHWSGFQLDYVRIHLADFNVDVRSLVNEDGVDNKVIVELACSETDGDGLVLLSLERKWKGEKSKECYWWNK